MKYRSRKCNHSNKSKYLTFSQISEKYTLRNVIITLSLGVVLYLDKGEDSYVSCDNKTGNFCEPIPVEYKKLCQM